MAAQPAVTMALEIRTSSGRPMHVGQVAPYGQKSPALWWQPWARNTSPLTWADLGNSKTAGTLPISTYVPRLMLRRASWEAALSVGGNTQALRPSIPSTNQLFLVRRRTGAALFEET
eukprot:scaffold2699_cov98-Isochrysis_galbana.AAC.7